MSEVTFARRLNPGDTVMVIAPSRSIGILSHTCRSRAIEVLERLGLKIEYGTHVDEDSWCSRLNDLHQAFLDPEVKGVLTAIGGFSANQLLPSIDFEVIKKNPKIFCGFSDITVLSLAIYQQTGLVTYSGPHFSTLSLGGCEGRFVHEYFEKVFFGNSPVELLRVSHSEMTLGSCLTSTTVRRISALGFFLLNKMFTK